MKPSHHLPSTLLALALIAALAVACAGPRPERRTATPSPAVTATTAPPLASPSLSPSPTPSPTCAERVFADMTPAQRVGQLFLLGMSPSGLGASEAAAIREHHFGSVTLAGKTGAGVVAVHSVTRAVQALATDSVTDGVGFFVAANQEGGEVQPLQGPGFERMPSALSQGSMSTSALQAAAERWGHDLRDAGVNLDLAPVADVVPPGTGASNPPIGAVLREFSHDGDSAGAHAAAFVRGMRAAHVATVAKHFPGLGRVHANTDFVADVVDAATGADDPAVDAFRATVSASVPFVMVALVTYTRIDADELAVFSSKVMRDLLRDDVGFDGVVVSDTLGAAIAVRGIWPGTVAIRYLEAGGDMITSDALAPALTMAAAILARAKKDDAFASRVDDAVLRVLRAKGEFGLLPCE